MKEGTAQLGDVATSAAGESDRGLPGTADASGVDDEA